MSRHGNKKKPKLEYQPSSAKNPTTQAMPDFNAMRPAWRVASIDLIHPDNWKDFHNLDAVTLGRIQSRLGNFESMTWNQIIGQQNHSIEVADLCTGAQKRLDDHQIATDNLVSLRCTGAQRIWGIRDENILRLLWWDPNHNVYPVAKK